MAIDNFNVLLICGDKWHPAATPIQGIEPLKEKGFIFDIIENCKNFNGSLLNKYRVVILAKSDETSETDNTSWKSEEIQDNFISYVENGGGLLVLHNGTVPGINTDKIDKLAGCRFVFHPHECNVIFKPVKNHPVTNDVQMFQETEEQYRLEIFSADIDIIAASFTDKQGDQNKIKEDPYNNAEPWISAAVFVRHQGRGRVCVITGGHNPAVWKNRQFQKLTENAIYWLGEK